MSDKKLGELIQSSTAGIFLGYQEDAGIVPIELISLKKPLIGVNEGGYVDLIKDHKLFYKIKEKHDHEEMVHEVGKGLRDFIKNYKKPKKPEKIKLKNFVKEVDKILSD